MVYLSVDQHRKLSHVVPLDEAGRVVLERRVPNEPSTFRRVVGELEPGPLEGVFARGAELVTTDRELLRAGLGLRPSDLLERLGS